MKKVSFIAAFLLLLVAFPSCDTEPIDQALYEDTDGGNPNGGGGGNTPTPGEFKVDFNGATYVATTVQAIYNADYLAITAIKPDGSIFQITIPEPEVGVTYTWPAEPSIDFGDNIALAYVPAGGGNAYVGLSDDYGEFADYPEYTDTAEVTITVIDTQNEVVSGTFKFTGARFEDPTNPENFNIETLAFTNGSFTNIPYSADVESPSDNSFFAKLDGNDFIPTNIMGYTAMNKISIVGRRGTVENIGITVPDDITPGTYSLNIFGDNVGIYILDSSPSGTFGADSGSVTISAHDVANGQITGTFHFTASMFGNTNTHTITEGSFDIGY